MSITETKMRTKDYIQIEEDLGAHNYHPLDVVIEKAKGVWVWDVEGKKYIDYCQSFGPLILGHLDPEVKEEVHRMIDTAWSFGACETYSLELAEFITTNIPFVEKLRFVSSGTEAVMSALRLARAFTKRSKVVKFDGCYHGHVEIGRAHV